MNMGSDTVFPAPVYEETVLAPLFEAAKANFLPAFRAIDQAHCVMLHETGILDKADAARIAAALAAMETDFDLADTVYDGSVEDLFFLVERELARRLGPDLAGRLHTGRSRNDMDHTGFRMVLLERLDRLARQALALAETLLAKAEAERDTLVVAYTHGQPAQPSTFGHYLSAALEVLLRDIDGLAEARRSVDLCPMGAAAITTSGFPLDRHRMAELLGFAEPMRNSYGCIAAADYVTRSYSAIALMMLHLGRPVQDFQFWSSFEAGQLHLPDGYVQISSIMPQKRNPVPIEHLRLLASLAAGQANGIVAIMHNTPFTDMNDSEGEVQSQGYEAFRNAGRVLRLMAGLVGAASIDGDRVRQNIDRSCITVTELADSLVRGEGLSFRQAHGIAAAVSRAAIARGVGPGEAYAAFREAFAAATGREPALGEAEFREAVSPARFVAVRERFGGPAPDALDAAFAAYRDALKRRTKAVDAAEARRSEAEGRRRDAFNTLVSRAA